MCWRFGALGLSSARVESFSLQHGHYSKPVAPNLQHTQRTENKSTDVVIQQHSCKLLMMDILMSETCWVHKKWNKIASDIKFVFYSSTTLLYICKSVRSTIFCIKSSKNSIIFFPLWRCGPTGFTVSSFMRFLDHTQRGTTIGRTPLDEWSARRRDIYLTTYSNHNRQTSISPAGFEFTHNPSKEEIHDLGRAVTGICNCIHTSCSTLTFPLWLWT